MQSERSRVRRKTNFQKAGPSRGLGCALVRSGCQRKTRVTAGGMPGATRNYGLVITSFGAFGRRKCTPRSRLACRVAGTSRSASKIFFDHEPLVQ